MPESEPNYYVIGSGVLNICNYSNRLTTSQLNSGITAWNTGVERTILANSCANQGVAVIDVSDHFCEQGPNPEEAWACAEYPVAGQVRGLYIEQDAPLNDNENMKYVAGHELGHNLGFAHNPFGGDGCNPNSIMTNDPCPTPITTLQQDDKDNYHKAYHVDPPEDFEASSFSGGDVHLDWGENLHNESLVAVYRQNECSTEWSLVGAASANTSYSDLGNQPGGLQYYKIQGLTNADPLHDAENGDASGVVSTTVPGVLPRPGGLSSSFPSPDTTKLAWTPVIGVDLEGTEDDGYYVVATQAGSPDEPFCEGPYTQVKEVLKDAWGNPVAEFFQSLPATEGVQWYSRVKACRKDGLCSAWSEQIAQVQYVDVQSGGLRWKYAFTYYQDNSGTFAKLQYANLMGDPPNSVYALQLHVLNGNQVTSPVVDSIDSPFDPTSCVPYFAVSPVLRYQLDDFGSKIGTRPHTASLMGSDYTVTCTPSHSGDASFVRWGLKP